jgi:hypothetical protein
MKMERGCLRITQKQKSGTKRLLSKVIGLLILNWVREQY